MAYKWGIVDEHRKLLYATAIIDATHFLGMWHGELFEVRCLPDSGSVAVGDLVFTHVLPSNSELVAIFRGGGLYLAPGKYNQHDGHFGQGTVYKLVGGVWQLLATFGRDEDADPDGFSDDAYVSCMFWDTSLKKLYAVPWYENWVGTAFQPNPEPYDLYEVNTQTGVVTGLGHSAVMRPVDEFANQWNNPNCYCQQATKFGNYWFITGVRQEEYVAFPGFYYERAVLYKFDPVANTMVLIDAEPVDHETSAYNPGVATEGTTLYWWFIDDDAANHIVYRSSVNGINFVTDEEHADQDRFPYAEMKYNPANGRFQVGDFGFAPRTADLLYRGAGPSWVVDQTLGVAGDPVVVYGIGFRYVGNVCTYQYIAASPIPGTQKVYSRPANSTGAFNLEVMPFAMHGSWYVNNVFASLNGRIYCFQMGEEWHRDSDVGVWAGGTVFNELQWTGGPLVHGFCMATSIPISEI